MSKLKFSINIRNEEDNNSQYSIVNPCDLSDKEQYNIIGKFFLKEDRLKYKIYKTKSEIKDYTSIKFSDKDYDIKRYVGRAKTVNYRVKNALHFGTYGFITLRNKTRGDSILLIHLMGEVTKTKNPNYSLDIGVIPVKPLDPIDDPTIDKTGQYFLNTDI